MKGQEAVLAKEYDSYFQVIITALHEIALQESAWLETAAYMQFAGLAVHRACMSRTVPFWRLQR